MSSAGARTFSSRLLEYYFTFPQVVLIPFPFGADVRVLKIGLIPVLDDSAIKAPFSRSRPRKHVSSIV